MKALLAQHGEHIGRVDKLALLTVFKLNLGSRESIHQHGVTDADTLDVGAHRSNLTRDAAPRSPGAARGCEEEPTLGLRLCRVGEDEHAVTHGLDGIRAHAGGDRDGAAGRRRATRDPRGRHGKFRSSEHDADWM